MLYLGTRDSLVVTGQPVDGGVKGSDILQGRHLIRDFFVHVCAPCQLSYNEYTDRTLLVCSSEAEEEDWPSVLICRG